jgi:hypothetical protein
VRFKVFFDHVVHLLVYSYINLRFGIQWDIVKGRILNIFNIQYLSVLIALSLDVSVKLRFTIILSHIIYACRATVELPTYINQCGIYLLCTSCVHLIFDRQSYSFLQTFDDIFAYLSVASCWSNSRQRMSQIVKTTRELFIWSLLPGIQSNIKWSWGIEMSHVNEMKQPKLGDF